MATFKICVFKHQVRKDGKYPVSIRVYWQRKSAYINTEYYVTIYQINQNKKKGIFELKDTAIIGELTKRIELFEKAKTDKLGVKIYTYSAAELANYFYELTQGKENRIDFIAFGRDCCEKRKEENKSFARIKTSLNCLQDFHPVKTIYIDEITSKFLKNFERFLKTERVLVRLNQHGKKVTTTHKPLSDVGVAGYMTDIRTVFNEAIEEYNDDEKGDIKITHYPFKKYKIPILPDTEKRNISKADILKIIQIPDENLILKRSILAKNTFILSFFLIGMNVKDLYDLQANEYVNGRFTYNRSKTQGRRKDKALISVKVEKEVSDLIEKYKDHSGERVFCFYKMYTTSHGFVSAMDKGLKKVADMCSIKEPLSSYYARHSWATIARNKCKIPKSDIDECLNHTNPNSRMADVYIEKDWSILDEANRKVLDFIFEQ